MESNNIVGNVHNEKLHQLSIQIEGKLCDLPPTRKSIFKVHNQLRRVKKRAYEPEFVAIGPYHHDKDDRLQYMQQQKLHYLQQMLRRRRETSVDRYVHALSKIEVQARQQYAERVTLGEKELIERMLLDGCFIIEYFRKYKMKTLQDENEAFQRVSDALQGENDPLLSVDWIRYSIQRDLLLLENQLPFIVLTTLYDLTKDDSYFDEQHYNLIDLAWNFFTGCTTVSIPQEISFYMHLLDLQYQGMIYKVSQEAPIEDSKKRKNVKFSFIRSAVELKESGIKFKSVVRDQFDIKLNKGILEIPTIIIQDHTEAYLRNLVAYEQHCQGRKINYVTDYVTFIDCLVSTPKDVELLCRKGIIDNYLGDDEAVSTMFNKMGNYVTISNFYYSNIFIEVNKQCKKRQNRWMAVLRRDYFHSPWAFISVLAAIMLLFLTLIQTVYTAGSYYKKN